MKNIAAVIEYHERTKHHPNRYAASLGYMDWATQPDPFRRYRGSSVVALPLPDSAESPTYAELFEPAALTSEPLGIASLSSLLRYSLGIAAWKCMGEECWALRCNASSGNLHPTEGYAVLPPVEGISDRSSIVHYAPRDHLIEILCTFDTDFWSQLPQNTILFGLSSVVWREAWKYGERAFRYTQLDAGHALRAVEISAALLGWQCRLFDAVAADTLDTLFGFDQPARFVPEENEIADMLLCISPGLPAALPDPILLAKALPETFSGQANLLSPAHHPWEAIQRIEEASHADIHAELPAAPTPAYSRTPNLSATDVILKRRSARAMDFGRTHIAYADFRQLLESTRSVFSPFRHACSLVLFVHDVETLESGLYLYALDPESPQKLKPLMRDAFAFAPVDTHLYLLERGDFRPQAKFISCSQDIASDGAFSLGMLCEFAPQIERHGPVRYKSLYWECGAVGQQLYLEATSLGLSATGIGCFLDDVMHRLLGLEDTRFQSLYHFTVGRAVVDMRLSTRPPYPGHL